MKKIKFINTIIILLVFSLFCSSAGMICVQEASAASRVLKGKKGWLFYKDENDGCNIPEYVGNNHYSKAAMKNIKNNLLKMKKAVNEKGAEFVIVIAPSKEIIYSEFMPDSIKRKSKVTRADQLVKYLRKNTDLRIVYPKDEFMEAKEEHQLYYKTDTHWNQKARFIAMQALRREVTGKWTSIDDMKFKKTATNYAGDLAVMLGQSSHYHKDTKYTPIIKLKKSEKSNKNIFIVGDSFGDGMVAGKDTKYFGKVSYANIWDYSMSQINKSTDVVVWEGAERYLDRFGTVDLYNR